MCVVFLFCVLFNVYCMRVRVCVHIYVLLCVIKVDLCVCDEDGFVHVAVCDEDGFVRVAVCDEGEFVRVAVCDEGEFVRIAVCD